MITNDELCRVGAAISGGRGTVTLESKCVVCCSRHSVDTCETGRYLVEVYISCDTYCCVGTTTTVARTTDDSSRVIKELLALRRSHVSDLVEDMRSYINILRLTPSSNGTQS